MKKIVWRLAVVAAAVTESSAQQSWHYDSARVEKLSEVVVSGVRAQKNAPYAVANIQRQELQQFSTSGQELPFLFSRTPGVVAWSENGVGTGTTYMRIRGAGDSRINVTLDGVPLNSPEDQCVFWANMNSYASLLGSVQIQRGVGTSTNGDGAFGGTVALQTATPRLTPSAEVSGSFGSYNTFNVGGSFSTGLLWKHLIVDAAYHETQTDGYVHGTKGRSGSYYGGLTWLSDRFQLRYKNIGNFEKTGQAWNGVTAGDDYLSLMDNTYGANTGIKTYADMYKAGLGQYNSLYERYLHEDPDDNYSGFARTADGEYKTARYPYPGGYWPRTTDNFWQNHNLLTAVYSFSDRLQGTVTLHYTHGHGYYDEFRYQNKLAKKFGINDTPVSKANVVRQKGLTQDAYGAVGSLRYQDSRWDVVGGFSVQQFDGNHYGYLTYISNDELTERLLSGGRKYQYYDSDAKKLDASAYVKAAYRFARDWQVFGDVQYRHVGYKTDGINDRFAKDANGLYHNQRLDIDQKYNFVNPKAGVSYSHGAHHAYASAAMSHREPERNNFTDNYKYPFPKAEQLLDFEAGYTYSTRAFRAGVNLYYMKYDNQFVQTGEESEIGEKLTANVKDSYRLGVELTAAVDPLPWLTIEGNAALSQNKIKDFDEHASVDWEDDWRVIHYDNSTLAFSPSAVLNGFVDLHYRGFRATWHTGFVSRQYLDNTECRDRSLPAYSTSDLQLSYGSKVTKVSPLKEVILGLSFNNVFNKHYAANAWVYSTIVDDYGHPNDNRYYQIGFIPMAGFTMSGNVTLKF